MYSRFLTGSLYGLSGEKCWVETDSENGLPSISIVGLANQSIKEAKDRIHSAIINSGFNFPSKKIIINLCPANKQKTGSHYDLAIALGVLKSCGLLSVHNTNGLDLKSCAFFGELSLDGRINTVEGLLPMIIGLEKLGVNTFFIPKDNSREASLVKNITIFPADNLKTVVNHINGLKKIQEYVAFDSNTSKESYLDFSDIHGQESVKRAAQIAAAGMHGLLMIGPPGVGKTMIGKRIPGILPDLSYQEQLEVTQIYSVAGELKNNNRLILNRPFRAPHHSMPSVALIGGGYRPKPGEISLAHNGILFLDELPEFDARLLDMLRQPLEDGFVSVSRINGKVTYPARFMLVAAMNPCKCGYYNDPIKPCTCTETERRRYVSKISGPLLDRIDMHIFLNRIVYSDMIADKKKDISTSDLKPSVDMALEIQKDRYKNLNICFNSQLTPDLIDKYCELNNACKSLMQNAYSKWNFSARTYHRILKVSRSIADLSSSSEIKEEHILEALCFRIPEQYFKE